jgi:hypothetical protein
VERVLVLGSPFVAPNLIDDPVGRDDLVPMDQEQRENGARLERTERQRRSVAPNVEVAEDSVFHRDAPVPSPPGPLHRAFLSEGSRMRAPT